MSARQVPIEEMPAEREHAFEITAADGPDTLLRLLGPFAVQQASVMGVRAVVAAGRVEVRITAAGLTAERAELLAQRLEGLPVVHAVELL